MAQKYFRAVVTFGATGSWVQNGFHTKEAAEQAAKVEAGKKKNRKKATGYRGEPE
jgi:hypothetical protein